MVAEPLSVQEGLTDSGTEEEMETCQEEAYHLNRVGERAASQLEDCRHRGILAEAEMGAERACCLEEETVGVYHGPCLDLLCIC